MPQIALRRRQLLLQQDPYLRIDRMDLALVCQLSYATFHDSPHIATLLTIGLIKFSIMINEMFHWGFFLQ